MQELENKYNDCQQKLANALALAREYKADMERMKQRTKEVEKEIYAFLGDVFEIKPDDLRHMKPKQVKELFKDADLEEWKDFFTDVVRFVRQS